LETEGKIKPRVRLHPFEKVKTPYPTKWTPLGAIQYRLWTPESRAPTITMDGYVLYTNQDVAIHGTMAIPTGIDLKLPPNTSVLITACNPTATYLVNMMTVRSEQQQLTL